MLKSAAAVLALSGLPVLAWSGDEPWPTAVLSPSGYIGAINTPTADVVPWGNASFGLSNNNPEQKRTIAAGHFGSMNAGFGLLPGLELVGRLAYEGEVDCSTFDSSCRHGLRDLSLSGKYQLPMALPLDTRVAVGFTDYGGPTAKFRQFYGVATSTWGPLDLSLGYSRARAPAALMDGPFGSVALRVSDRWSAALEHDSRNARAGLHYSLPVFRDAALQLGVSRLLSQDTGLKPWQASATLNVSLDRVAESAPRVAPAFASVFAPVSTQAIAPLASAALLSAATSAPVVPYAELATVPVAVPTAESVAQGLVERGFAQVEVRHWAATATQPALWSVRAEPRRWRQSQIEAMGVALAAWLRQQGVEASGSRPADELLLTLTWQREPVLHAYTSARCLEGWREGWTRCELGPQSGLAYGRALQLSRDREGLGPRLAGVEARMRQASESQARASGGPAWMPQFEIGPGLRYNVGTELGLLDYSVALEVGAEVNLAPGLSWQGVLSTPVAHSDDYDDGKPFAANRHPKLGLDSSLLSWWKPLPHGVAAQASAGYIDRRYKGGMVDAVWMNDDGRLRLSATAGTFQHDTTRERQNPLLGSARWSLVPGVWQLEATAGRFLGGDKGYRLASHHWFGDTLFKLYYRDSQGDAGSTTQTAQRKFVGFSLSFPLGPKTAHAVGPVTVRGADRLALGLETKVGESDNSLTYGYGEIPRVRHGVLSDVSDHDRNGQSDLLAQYRRLRAVLSEQLATQR